MALAGTDCPAPTVTPAATTATPQADRSSISSGRAPTLAPSSTVTFSARMAYCTRAPFFTRVPGIRMEELITAPSSTVTSEKRMEKSTSPAISPPSEIILFCTRAVGAA